MKKIFKNGISFMFLALLLCVAVFAAPEAEAASYPSVFPEEYSITAKPGDVVELKYTIFHEYQNEAMECVIMDSDGAILASSEKKFYPSTYSTEYTITWDTTGYLPGEYKAVAKMTFYTMGAWYYAPNEKTITITLEGEVDKGGKTPEEAIKLKNDEWHIKGWSKKNYDQNCYNKIVLSDDGYITFTTKKIMDDDGEVSSVDLTLLDKSGKKLWVVDTEYLSENSFSENCVYKIGLAAGTYYMNITPNFSVTSGMFECEYKYKFTKASNWEKESNNTVSKATPITLGKAYNGVYCETSYSVDDEDCYSFTLKKGVKYTLSIKNYDELDEDSVIFELNDPDSESVYLGTGKSKDNSQVWTFTAEKSGKYIYRIRNDSNRNPVEYQIKVSGPSGSSHKHSYKTTKTTKATLTKNGKITQKCSCGETKSTTIYYPKSIKLSATSYTYNGKAKTPSVTVKDSKGKTLKKDTDYTVKYSSGRKNVGKYTVTVTFKGKYSGTKKLTFKVVLGKASISKLTAGSKQLTAAWKSVSGATGYEVQASTSKSFSSKTTKKVTIKKAKSTKTTIKKLTKGKSYFVKVRAYKTVDGKKVYGAWSSVKSVKVK